MMNWFLLQQVCPEEKEREATPDPQGAMACPEARGILASPELPETAAMTVSDA